MTNLTEINYNEYSVEELETAKLNINTVLKTMKARILTDSKELKAKAREKADLIGRSLAKQDAIVSVVYKSHTVSGKVINTKPKTFDMIIPFEGEDIKIWRYYYDIINSNVN